MALAAWVYDLCLSRIELTSTGTQHFGRVNVSRLPKFKLVQTRKYHPRSATAVGIAVDELIELCWIFHQAVNKDLDWRRAGSLSRFNPKLAKRAEIPAAGSFFTSKPLFGSDELPTALGLDPRKHWELSQ